MSQNAVHLIAFSSSSALVALDCRSATSCECWESILRLSSIMRRVSAGAGPPVFARRATLLFGSRALSRSAAEKPRSLARKPAISRAMVIQSGHARASDPRQRSCPTMRCAVRNGMPVMRTRESASSVAVEKPAPELCSILSRLNLSEETQPSRMRTVLLVQSMPRQR